jgi:hypothetical protein
MTFAPTIINNYIWDCMQVLDPVLTAGYAGIVPFFPLYDNQAGNAKWGTKPYAVYDIMSPARKAGLYAVKRSQMLYSIRGTVPDLFTFRDLIIDIIDRDDDAGKDVNEWAGINAPDNDLYFHRFAVNEVNWSSEITIAKDTRQAVTKDLIVEFFYHKPQYRESA